MSDDDDGYEYDFASNGDCAICDGVEGTYDEPPDRPHPNCQCEIYAIAKGLPCPVWWWAYVGHTERDPVRPNKAFNMEIKVSLECCDGWILEENHVVHFEEPLADLDDIEETCEEVAGEVADVLATECQPPLPNDNVDSSFPNA